MSSEIIKPDEISKMLDSINDDSASKDFEKARLNITAVIDVVQNAVVKFAEIADQSQDDKAYGVLAKLVDTAVNANKSLLDLQTKVRSIQTRETPINGKSTVNNNLFVGSTADLQKFLEEMKTDGRKKPK